MSLDELIPAIANFKKIIVTGPQRSGTTISTKIIAQILQYHAHLEEDFDVDDIVKFVNILACNVTGTGTGMVLQAPGLSSIVHLLHKADIAVIFLMRDIDEIRNSEERIAWRSAGYEMYEKLKYFKGDSLLPISAIKYEVWNDIQKSLLKNNWFELDYHSLSSHILWVEKEKRSHFNGRQTD